MAKRGISIKQLARELGVTSRHLIDRCREAGIAAQNSITKLDSSAERKARALFNPCADPDLPEGGSGGCA